MRTSWLAAVSVCALACGGDPAVAPDAASDDGGVRNDAPRTDGNTPGTDGGMGVDATLPPPGADEPVYVEGTSTSIFYEPYESYADAAALLDGSGDHTYVTNSAGLDGITIVSGSAAAGERNVHMNYQVAGEYSHLLETFDVGDRIDDTVVVAFTYRNTGDWYEGKVWIGFVDDSAGRLLLHSANEPILSPNDLAGCFYSGDVPLRPDIPPPWSTSFVWNRDPLDHHYGQNMAWDDFQLERDIADGAWHRLTTRFTRELAGPGTGRLEMWVDGVKVTEYVGDDPARCEYQKIPITTTQIIEGFNYPGPSSFRWDGGGDIEYDEMRIFVP